MSAADMERFQARVMEREDALHERIRVLEEALRTAADEFDHLSGCDLVYGDGVRCDCGLDVRRAALKEQP